MLYIDTNTFSLGKYIHSPKANDAEKYFSLQPNCDYIAAKTQRLNILNIEQLLQQCSLTMEALNQSAQDCVFVFIGNCQKETVNELSISKVN